MAFRRRALTALGEVSMWLEELNGGTFSLLKSPSTTAVVRARFRLGVLSGVCNCSQNELVGEDEGES